MATAEAIKVSTLPERMGKFSRRQIASIISPRRQEFTIFPTEKCNLRCTYCYEDFSIGKMSLETQGAVEKLIARRVEVVESLYLSWFGGEPLVAKDVVMRLAKFSRDACAERDVDFAGGLTTNAYLLDLATFEELVSYRQNFFQITLDGWGDTHDQVRKFANGRGTFDVIWKNLLAIKNTSIPCEIIIRVHVRRDNIDNLSILMEELGKSFGGDERFRLDFEHVRNLGGAGGASVRNPVSLSELQEIEVPLRAAFSKAAGIVVTSEELEKTSSEAIIQSFKSESSGSRRKEDIVLDEPYICYASKPNSLLIRADGTLSKCTVALYDDRNKLGKLRADGTIDIDNGKLRKWVRGLEDLDESTLGCPLQGLTI